MNNYYKTNNVYDRLEAHSDHLFNWVAGNAWFLVYGDGDANPAVNAAVWGETVPMPKDMLRLFMELSSTASLPFACIRFDDAADSITSVQLSVNGERSTDCTLEELRSRFASFGLPLAGPRSTAKAINDRASSAYHHWQRQNLGRITVSDIDLLRLSEDGTPAEIIELKRSIIPLHQWKPYPVDYPNFNLLSVFADQCDLALTIAYNVRHKNPFRDDASTLSIFDYKREQISHLGVVSFADFVSGKYRGDACE